MISHTTAQFRNYSPNCLQRFNVKPVEHIASSARIRIIRVFVSRLSILHAQSILHGSAPAIEQWGSYKAMKLCGIGSAHMQTMINSFHNRAVECKEWLLMIAGTPLLTSANAKVKEPKEPFLIGLLSSGGRNGTSLPLTR